MAQKINIKTPASESEESIFSEPAAHIALSYHYIEASDRNHNMSPEKWVAATQVCVKKFSKIMTVYSKYIKRGAVILSIDMGLDSDINNWDMESLATIGLNTSMKFSYGADTYSFDVQRSAWVSDSGKQLPYNTETGLPVRE